MASGHELVSVLVAASGRTAHLHHAVQSVLAQTHRPLELIVVGGAGAAEGALAARRRALAAARGAYVAFLDADDLLAPDKIARQAALLDARPRLGAVHCGYHEVDPAGRLIDTAGRQPEGDVRAQLLRGCFPWSGGPLVRRELLPIGADEPLHWLADWAMWLRVALTGHGFGCVQSPLGFRRVRPDCSTEEDVVRGERVVLEVLGEAYRRWALPADVVVQEEQIRAGWHVRLGCRYESVGAAGHATRSFARAASLCPAWRDDPAPLLAQLHVEVTSSPMRPSDPVRVVREVMKHLPSELARARDARGVLLGRVHVTLALRAYATGDRTAGREHLVAAADEDPRLIGAPERFAGDLASHARRLATDDPRAFVLRVLDDLPACARELAQARPVALAEIAVAETLRRHRLPVVKRRMACAATGGTHPREVMLRAPRRAPDPVVEVLRQPNPRRSAASPRDRRASGVPG